MYAISLLSDIINGKIIGNPNVEVLDLCIDSRTTISPQNAMFVAIDGARHDGHKYIADLYERNFRIFLVSKWSDDFDSFVDATFIWVDDTLRALQKICAYHRNQFDYPVVGITGSNGKTVVKEWLYQLLCNSKQIIRSPKSYNSQVGVPLSVWKMDSNFNLAIFEAGISQTGEMTHLQNIILPTIGIFTNIGDAHQENFSDYEQKINEKLLLLTDTKILIYCKDYIDIDRIVSEKFKNSKTTIFCWSKKEYADLKITNITKLETYTNIQAKHICTNFSIDIPFTDDASIENAIHCAAALIVLGYNPLDFAGHFKQLMPVAMRLELKQGINNCTLINDSYNSDLGSLTIALDLLNQQQQHSKLTLIISDILQTGSKENLLYKNISELLSQKKIDKLIGIGEAISRNAEAFANLKIADKYFYQNTTQFLEQLNKSTFFDEAILLKGSRSFEFERISNLLQKKSHRTILEINLNAIIHNINYFKSLLKPQTKIMAMVKAFSYGSGTYEIANMLQYHRIDYLAVAFPDEGAELRRAGISLPIMILNSDESSFQTTIENNLEPEIFSFENLLVFDKMVEHAVGRQNKYPIHIKLDTGMHRLGFGENEIPQLIQKLASCKNVFVKSILSHLAASDEAQHDDYTHQQAALFEKMSSEIIAAIQPQQTIHIERHLLNSAGIERFPQYQYDMVRLGIGMYGISVVDQNKLMNVSTFKTQISQIRKLTANQTVGYGRKGKLTHDATIATVPVGYADGLNRRLSNGVGIFLINGHNVSIIGNICMDMTMVDVTDINCSEGDEVIIFGDGLSVTLLAEKLQTIPYEIFTNISSRVKRIYYQE